MLATIGAIGKALLPTLLTIGSSALTSSRFGTGLKKFFTNDGVGPTIASAAAQTFNNIVQRGDQTSRYQNRAYDEPLEEEIIEY